MHNYTPTYLPTYKNIRFNSSCLIVGGIKRKEHNIIVRTLVVEGIMCTYKTISTSRTII